MRSASVHTLITEIYEFKGSYFIIELSRQGTKPDETSYQGPSESRALSAKLPIGGSAARRALANFDIEPPKYDSWESKELVKQLIGWLGARGFATIEKNSRKVQVKEELASGTIKVFPYDTFSVDLTRIGD